MKDMSMSFATTILIQIVNILTGLLAARILLPEGRGELAEIMLWPGLLLEFGILAMSDALLYRAATRLAPPKVLFATAMWIGVAMAAILVVAGYLLMPLVLARETATVRMVESWYLAVFVPIYLFSLFVAVMFQGHLDLFGWNVVRAIVGLGYLAFIGLFLAAGFDDVGHFAMAYVAGTALSGIVGLIWLHRKGWTGWRPDFGVAKAMLGYGARVHLGEMINSLRQRVDQIGVATFLTSHDMGLYVVALTVANGPMILVNTIAGVAFPKISGAPGAQEKLRIFGIYLRLAMAMSVASAAGLAILAEWVVPLIFGQAFDRSATLCQIMLLGLPFFAAKLMFIQALNAFDRSLAIGWAEAFGLAAALAALFVLLPWLGIEGAAWALVVANIAALGAMAGSLNRQIGAPVLAMFKPTPDDWAQVTALLAKVRR